MKITGEKETERILRKAGFQIVDSDFLTTKGQLEQVIIDFPWVMKIVSKEIIHKARAGGVILDIDNIKQAEKAFDRLEKKPGFKGVLIQKQMKNKGQELILGLKDTKEFGLVIMLGSGGTKVEEEQDISFRVLPIDEKQARSMIEDLDIDISNKKLVVENLLMLNKLAKKYPLIQELDINPLIVNKKEAIIVDARAVLLS